MKRPHLFTTFLCPAALAVAGCAHAQGPAEPVAQAVSSAQPEYLTIEQLRERYGDAQSRYLTIKGVEVHYKDEGSGPVLLMVHGSQSTLRTWDRITEQLKSRYRIVRFDIPGYGLSGRVTDDAAANVAPEDIAEGLVNALGITRLTGIGVSSGGTMVAYLAAQRPDLVERLILSNMPSDPVKTDHLVITPGFRAAQERYQATKYYDQDFWVQYLGYFSGDPARISDRTLKEYWDFNRRTPEAHPIALVARIGDGVEAKAKMATITAPALLIWGTADKLLPEPAADALEGYLPNSQISRILMPDVGHYPPLEVPDRFADLIAAYVESAVPDPEAAE